MVDGQLVPWALSILVGLVLVVVLRALLPARKPRPAGRFVDERDELFVELVVLAVTSLIVYLLVTL